MKLDFGKHRGCAMDDVPIQYLIFLSGYRLQGTCKLKNDSKASLWVEQHRPEVRRAATNLLRNKCWRCFGCLQPVGFARANGKPHDDWEGRVLHKKCWLEIKREEEEWDCWVSDQFRRLI